MRRYLHKVILALLSLLVLGQSLLPVAALAEVSVRCNGASKSSKPCAQATLIAADVATIDRYLSGLACCKDMVGCSAMMASGQGHSPQNALSTHSNVESAARCLVSINLLNTKPATLGPQANRWLLRSFPSLAPPALHLAPSAACVLVPNHCSSAAFALLPSATVRSHGLRGPPCA